MEREQKDNTHVELAGKNFKVVILTRFKNKGKIILQDIKWQHMKTQILKEEQRVSEIIHMWVYRDHFFFPWVLYKENEYFLKRTTL